MRTSSAVPHESGAPRKLTVAPHDEHADGPNQTIASYIRENNIGETQVRRGDPGAPTIDLPTPKGWESAGKNAPEWAYAAFTYTGPEVAEYAPRIVATLSRLTGNADPQKIVELAPGEMKNLPGFVPLNTGATTELGAYPAHQMGGVWQREGHTRVIGQKTVVIPREDGLYVLQLNADGLQAQDKIINEATDYIDTHTTITF